ncbi:MAG: winged helix-turn-helix transcriptional regulator, partial [Geminicoccaceae bacterium]
QKPRYFGEIKSRLVSITDRALSQSLKQLESHQWLHREIDTSSRTVRPRYQAANTGAKISQAASL